MWVQVRVSIICLGMCAFGKHWCSARRWWNTKQSLQLLLETINILCLFYIKILNLQFFFEYVVFGPVILCIFFSQVAQLRVIYTPKCASDCPLQAMPRVLKPIEKAKGISSPVSRSGNFRLHTMKWKVSIPGTPCFCQLSQVHKFRTESLKKWGWVRGVGGGLTEPAICDQQPTPKPAVKYAEND